MTIIGIVAGAFKPLTAGHFHIMAKAAHECEQVMIYVSTGDRARPGEFPIYWKDMQTVWSKFIEPAIKSLGTTLKAEINIEYCSVPIGSVMRFLREAEDNPEASASNIYVIYSDPVDIEANFDEDLLEENFPELTAEDEWKEKQLFTWPVDRSETSGISGTIMRQALGSGDLVKFMKGLPVPLKDHGSEIFVLLRGRSDTDDTDTNTD